MHAALFDEGSARSRLSDIGAFLATAMAEVTAASGPVHHPITPVLPVTRTVAGLIDFGRASVLPVAKFFGLVVLTRSGPGRR